MTIVDPCLGTSINVVTFTPSLRSVVNGETASVNFVEATDTVEVSNNIDTLCGPRFYQLLSSNGSAAPSFISLTGPNLQGIYTVNALPSLYAQLVPLSHKMEPRLLSCCYNKVSKESIF